jgi:hypothetical protein
MNVIDAETGKREWLDRTDAYNEDIAAFHADDCQHVETRLCNAVDQGDLYLKTPEWKAKRDRVMKRANGLCEGCLIRPATEVHHRYYGDYPNEFMFDLLALCDDCHDRLHPEKNTAVESADDWSTEHPCAACRWQSEKKSMPWCGWYDLRAVDALAADGECGPERRGYEGLK